MTSNDLVKLIVNDDISLDYYDLPVSESLSIMDYEGNCYIAIDLLKIKSFAEVKYKLAHECGHCKTGSFYNRYSSLDIVEKHEKRADRWAIQTLVPKEELEAACQNGYYEVWELAEYFGVPENLIRKASELYHNY